MRRPSRSKSLLLVCGGDGGDLAEAAMEAAEQQGSALEASVYCVLGS